MASFDLHFFSDRNGQLAFSCTKPDGTRTTPKAMGVHAIVSARLLAAVVAGDDGLDWLEPGPVEPTVGGEGGAP